MSRVTPLSALLLLLAVGTSSAWAREFSIPIDVQDEEELRQLYADGQIEEEEYEALLALLEAPVDLNRAERDDVFALPGVSFAAAEAIVEERVVNGSYLALADVGTRVPQLEWQTLARIEPFTRVQAPQGTKPGARAHIDFLMLREWDADAAVTDPSPRRAKTVQQLGYDHWPAFALGAGVNVRGWLEVGLVGTAQESVRSVQYEPASRDLYVSWGTPTFRPNLGFVSVRRPEGQAIVGHYHVAYGLGLTMSTLSGRQRHGAFERSVVNRGEDRLRPFDGLLGGNARLLALRAGRFDLDLSVFGSIRNYDIFSSYIGLAGGQELQPVGADVPSPRIWMEGQRALYLTIPDVIRVALAGGDFTVRFNKRTRLELTGYAAYKDGKVIPGVDGAQALLIRQRWPSAQHWGAFGLSGAVGVGQVDLSGEVTLWFDRSAAVGAVFFAEFEPQWGELVLSVRHYDEGFANPYARAEAAPDTLGGIRARNENGFRATLTATPIPQLRFGGRFDLSQNLRYDVFDMNVRAHVDVKPLPFLGISGGLSWTDQDLANGGPGQRYSGTIDYETLGYDAVGGEVDVEDLPTDLDAERTTLDHAGERVALWVAARLADQRRGDIMLRYSHDFTDDRKTWQVSPDTCQLRKLQGHSVRLAGRVRPHRSSTVLAGFQYWDADLVGDQGIGRQWGERGVRATLGYDQKVKDTLTFRLRGAFGRRLPNPPSACDEAGDDGIPAPVVDYAPDEHALRWFGEFSFWLRVSF